MIVASSQKVDGEAWCSAAAWWPKAAEAEAPSVLYTIEARWDAQGGLIGLRWLQFPAA